MIFERSTFIEAPLDEVFSFFAEPENLGRITPPSYAFRFRELPPEGMKSGARIVIDIRVAGIPTTWVSRITHWDRGRAFIDEQERGPYRRWIHTHTFLAVPGGVQMQDLVEYELPFGLLGRLLGGWFVRRQLQALFDFRAKVIRSVLG